eukprot:414109-Amphidinium_carterae.1
MEQLAALAWKKCMQQLALQSLAANVELCGNGLLRPSQFPSIDTIQGLTLAYRYTPIPAGGGANVASRMQRMVNPTTQMPFAAGEGGNDYVLDHNRQVVNPELAPGEAGALATEAARLQEAVAAAAAGALPGAPGA